MYLSRSIVIVFLVTSLTACGFSLRESTYLPSPLISMQLLADDLNSRQKNELRQQLIQAGANLIDNTAGDAISLKVVIKVLPERITNNEQVQRFIGDAPVKKSDRGT